MKVLLFLLFSTLASITAAEAAECRQPDSAKMAEVMDYVVKKYQIATASHLTLTASAKANDNCFWKLQYAAAPPKREIVLYLSPDRKYLVPLLYDLTADPMAEIRARDEEFSHELATGASPPLGAASAPVTIVEFSDFQCPFCKRMADVLEKEVLPKESARVNVVFRNFPLSMHPWAKSAAEIAECAELQQSDAFWAIHDFLFQNQQTLKLDNIVEKSLSFAAGLKDLDQTKFAACVNRELGLGPVTQDQRLGDRLEIHGTPTIFVNGVRFDGIRSADEIDELVERAARGELAAPVDTPIAQSATSAALTRSPGAGAVQCAPPPGRSQ